jgi:hypothetical protein
MAGAFISSPFFFFRVHTSEDRCLTFFQGEVNGHGGFALACMFTI